MAPKRDLRHQLLAFRSDVVDAAWKWAEELLGPSEPKTSVKELVEKIVRATYHTLSDEAKKRYARGWTDR